MPETDLDRVLAALRPDVVMEGARNGVAWFHPQPEHRGVPGWVHGGFAAVVLDHVCARTAAHVLGERVVTGTLDLRYPQPLPLDGGPYRIEAEAAPHKGRLVKLRAAIMGADGRQMVQAKALFVTLDSAVMQLGVGVAQDQQQTRAQRP
ncbi:MAG: PaaI family thioesterase [Acidimicrobiia bacterium]|nr:PaaI family thioesterase [Acidimicrobiia bacterium]MDH5290138.1 PaaI family thioesterase [Acidimicrobiia bacterium]